MTLQNLNKTKTVASVVLAFIASGAQAADEPLITVRKAPQQNNDMPLITLHNKGDNRLFKKKTNNTQTNEPRASDYQPINSRDNPLPPISTIVESHRDTSKKQTRKNTTQTKQAAPITKSKDVVVAQHDKKVKPNPVKPAKKTPPPTVRPHKSAQPNHSALSETVAQQKEARAQEAFSQQSPSNPVEVAKTTPVSTPSAVIENASTPKTDTADVAQLRDIATRVVQTEVENALSTPPTKVVTAPKKAAAPAPTMTANTKQNANNYIWQTLAGMAGLGAAMALAVVLRRRKSDFRIEDAEKPAQHATSDTDALLNGTFSWTKDKK